MSLKQYLKNYLVNHTRNEHHYTVVINKLGCCILQGLENVVRITKMKQEKRYLMMVMEIFKNHHLVTIATTKRDRTCQPTVTTYFQFNIFCTSILTISELAKLLSHVQYKMLSSVPSVILSIPDEGYFRNLACALALISTLLF